MGVELGGRLFQAREHGLQLMRAVGDAGGLLLGWVLSRSLDRSTEGRGALERGLDKWAGDLTWRRPRDVRWARGASGEF